MSTFACERLNRWATLCAAALCAGLVVVCGAAMSGCSGGAVASAAPGPATGAGGTERVVRAEWSDVDAAVDIALSRTEMAISKANPAGEHYRLYNHALVTINGRRGVLTIERMNPPEKPRALAVDRLGVLGAGAEEIRMKCRVGDDGDATAEGAMLSAIESRLEELKGDGAKRLKDEAFEIKDK